MSEQPDRCSYPHFTTEGVQKSHNACLSSNSSLHAPGSVRTWALLEKYRLQTRRPLGMIHPALHSFHTRIGFLLSSSLWEPWVGGKPQHPGWLQRVLRWVVSPESLFLYASVSHMALIGISLLWVPPCANGASTDLCPNPFHQIQGHGDWWLP